MDKVALIPTWRCLALGMPQNAKEIDASASAEQSHSSQVIKHYKTIKEKESASFTYFESFQNYLIEIKGVDLAECKPNL